MPIPVSRTHTDGLGAKSYPPCAGARPPSAEGEGPALPLKGGGWPGEGRMLAGESSALRLCVTCRQMSRLIPGAGSSGDDPMSVLMLESILYSWVRR